MTGSWRTGRISPARLPHGSVPLLLSVSLFLPHLPDRFFKACRVHPPTALLPGSLPDAEAAEDDAQQVVSSDGAGDATQRVVGKAQFLGKQVERGIALGDMTARVA